MKSNQSHILISPRVTEKGAYLSESGAYIFNVSPSANKQQIAAAILLTYKVSPRMVRVLSIPSKKRMTRGTNRMGKSAGGKKAYVYLKKGETIEIV